MSYDNRSSQQLLLPFRIFLASPGDVEEERKYVRSIVEKINGEATFLDHISLKVIAWDQPGTEVPMQAALTPQKAIEQGMPKPSDCDLVVVIFWSRIGTPLPSNYVKPDGSQYLSGTEWEYYDAVTAFQKHRKPEVWLYRSQVPPSLPINDPSINEKQEQWSLLDKFFNQLINPDGSIAGGINYYTTHNEFQKQFEGHLRNRLTKELQAKELQGPVLLNSEIRKDCDLLKLLLSQKDRIRNCIIQIKLLAKCKRVHDSLHHIRQNGIVLWRNEVLSHWKLEEGIDNEAKLSFVEAQGNIQRHLGELNMLMKDELPNDHNDILDKIQLVLNFELPDRKFMESQNWKKSNFEKITDHFEEDVQKAFTSANFAMSQQLNDLWKAHSDLTKGLSVARRDQALSYKQDRLLDEQLELLKDLIDDLQKVIRRHNRWQNIHDELYCLGTSKKEDFLFDLKQFLGGSYRKKIDELLMNIEADPLPISPEYLEYRAPIKKLIYAKDELEQQAVTLYSSMREAFDKLFFQVDKDTSRFVDQAEHQVEKCEESLRKLEDEVVKRSSDSEAN